MAAEYVRFRGHQPAQATQQVGAAVQPDQRIGIRNLHTALKVGNAQVCKDIGIDPQGLKGIGRECAACEHRKAGQPQSFRTADRRAG